MPRVFFHFCDGVNLLLDEEGSVLDFEAIPAKALAAAGGIIGHDAMSGRINLSYSIEARDEAGKTIHTLYFTDAVEIVGTD
jgi:hypothetical protein